jgi:hypothetical protein
MEGDDDVVPLVRSWEVDVFQTVELVGVVITIVQAVRRARIFLVVVVLKVVFLMVVTMAPVSPSSSKTPSPRPFFGYCLRFVSREDTEIRVTRHGHQGPSSSGGESRRGYCRTLQLL